MVDPTPAMAQMRTRFHPRGLVQRRYYINRKKHQRKPGKKKRICQKEICPQTKKHAKILLSPWLGIPITRQIMPRFFPPHSCLQRHQVLLLCRLDLSLWSSSRLASLACSAASAPAIRALVGMRALSSLSWCDRIGHILRLSRGNK